MERSAPVWSRRMQVMGILNTTPDSFSDGGLWLDPESACNHALRMIEEGADILDLGGVSSRPGSDPVTVNDELSRVLPVLKAIRSHTDHPVSIDTTRADVARACLDAGANWINDISATRFDPEMASLIVKTGCPVVLMHIQGTPQTMQNAPRYNKVVQEVKRHLLAQARRLELLGHPRERIILDPGIGFGKTCDHNLSLLQSMEEFKSEGHRLMIGASRKRVIGDVLDLPVEERLEGTLAISVLAVVEGADIVRVHDVAANVRAIVMAEAIVNRR